MCVVSVNAQEDAADNVSKQPPAGDAQSGQLTVDRIYGKNEFKAESFSMQWLSDGSYERLETMKELESDNKTSDAKDKDKQDAAPPLRKIIRYNPLSGDAEIMVESSALKPKEPAAPLSIDDYAWSADEKQLLIFTNSKRVWRTNSRGDYWVYNIKSGSLKQLGRGFAESSLMFAKFSPDSRRVAYVHQNDIWLETIDTGAIRRLTRRESDKVINGAFDWVYEEEFQIQDGFRWSPDGRRIAFWKIDTTDVEVFSLVNNTNTLYPTVQEIPWPKAGQRNSACSISIVDTSTEIVTPIALPGDPRENYVPRIHWSDDGQSLAIEHLNRAQNQLTIRLADPRTGNSRQVYADTDEAWVDVDDDFAWQPDGKSFVWSSESSGWRRVYDVPLDGTQPVALTADSLDVIAFLGVGKRNREELFPRFARLSYRVLSLLPESRRSAAEIDSR